MVTSSNGKCLLISAFHIMWWAASSSNILLFLFKWHEWAEIDCFFLEEPVSFIYVCQLSFKFLHSLFNFVFFFKTRLQKALLPLELVLLKLGLRNMRVAEVNELWLIAVPTRHLRLLGRREHLSCENMRWKRLLLSLWVVHLISTSQILLLLLQILLRLGSTATSSTDQKLGWIKLRHLSLRSANWCCSCDKRSAIGSHVKMDARIYWLWTSLNSCLNDWRVIA